MTRQHDGERGGALVELAMSLPILVFLVVGAVDYARIFYTSLALSNAARAGAQYGAYTSANVSDTAGITNAARNASTDIGTIGVVPTCSYECKTGGSTVITLCPNSPPACGGTMRIYSVVVTTKTFTTKFRFRGLPSSVNLSRSASMRAQ